MYALIDLQVTPRFSKICNEAPPGKASVFMHVMFWDSQYVLQLWVGAASPYLISERKKKRDEKAKKQNHIISYPVRIYVTVKRVR